MHVIIRGEGYSPGNNIVLFGHVFKAGAQQTAAIEGCRDSWYERSVSRHTPI
jgi:hypothetical protein